MDFGIGVEIEYQLLYLWIVCIRIRYFSFLSLISLIGKLEIKLSESGKYMTNLEHELECQSVQ